MQFNAWSVNSGFLWDCSVCAKLIKELEAIVGTTPASGKKKSGLLVSLGTSQWRAKMNYPDLHEEADLTFPELWRAYISIPPWAGIA